MIPSEMFLGDCVDVMRGFPGECIPLTVTSPPYDTIRQYGGHSFQFEDIAKELFRITVPGGVVVWVVRDEVKDGQESGTSCRQCLYFGEVGFWLHTTLILVSNVFPHPHDGRYGNQAHFGYVLSRGRPRTVNLLHDRPNSTAGDRIRGCRRHRDGRIERAGFRGKLVRPYGRRTNVWTYDVGGNKSTGDSYCFAHPALMPEAMAGDLILSWSQRGDVVLDPLCGAGTTCKMALLNDRRYFGIEVHRPYYELAVRRMQEAKQLDLSTVARTGKTGSLRRRRRAPNRLVATQRASVRAVRRIPLPVHFPSTHLNESASSQFMPSDRLTERHSVDLPPSERT
jgi:site-specific DNA-methyltransferase (adenine-specific)